MKRFYGFCFVFTASFLICTTISYTYVHNKILLEFAQMEHLASTRINKVNAVITRLLYKTQALSALVVQNNGDVKDFERVAATIIDDPAILNIIIAPDGVVADVYPREENEKVIGFNYFDEAEGNHEARDAKNKGQLVLGGPFTLIQGGQALVGRLPVYTEDAGDKKHFWGLVSVTLRYPQALEGAELEQLKNQGFAYEIWRVSPDTREKQIIAHSTYTYNKQAQYVEQAMNLLNANWYFRLSPIRRWYQHPETWIFSFSGLVISLLIASLIVHNYDLKQLQAKLEDLTYCDQLTGVLNRRGIFQFIEELIALPNKKFILCYIDLNHFKAINDTYGHSVGDAVLRKFVQVIGQHLDAGHTFARIGGDEFIIVFDDTDDKAVVDRFFERIYTVFEDSVSFGQVCVDISFSMGKAFFPADGLNFDALIEYADSDMYKEKAKSRRTDALPCDSSTS